MNSVDKLDNAIRYIVLHFDAVAPRLKCADIQYEWLQDSRFCAKISSEESGFLLQVSVGLVEAAQQHWAIAQEKTSLLDFGEQVVSKRIEQMIHTSLLWLILHEVSHVQLNHFKMMDSFGVAQRLAVKTDPISAVPLKRQKLAPLCLELQADHEATDMMLAPYSTDSWDDLRKRVLAISGVMMLIELEDKKSGAGGLTHPKAATRIFQLLGHLAEMPLVRAQVHQDTSLIPVEEELQAFAHGVTIPCFFDAIQLAQAAGAASIADDLGSPEDFFKDLEIAKLGDPSRYGDLQTQGAQEWAKLWPCNEALKPILGGHFTN